MSRGGTLHFWLGEFFLWLVFLAGAGSFFVLEGILKWGVFVFWIVLLWAHFLEPFWLQVEKKTVSLSELPALKIAIFSDLHLSPGKGEHFLQLIVTEISKHKVDAVLIPGDFFWGRALLLGEKLAPLKKLSVPVFATLGNHDHFPEGRRGVDQSHIAERFLKSAGVQLLRNEAYFWPEKKMWIAGTDDNDRGFDDLDKTMGSLSLKHPFLLLAHSPDIVKKFSAETSPALTVSGHTHGGQCRIPFLGAVPGVIPCETGRKFQRCWYPSRRLFVSGGVGESALRLRFWNRPVLTLLENNPDQKA